MKHIKTKMLAIIVPAVVLSCLFANGITITLLRRLYMDELHASSESTARQILLTTDSTVNTIEGILTLVFDSRGTNALLTQTDFRRENGDVYIAYRDLDSVMNNIEIQFEQFSGLLFRGVDGGIYRYHYYNKSMLNYARDPDAGARQRWVTSGDIRWDGLYDVDNALDASSDRVYVVSKAVTNGDDMRYAGVAVAFFADDLFTSALSDVERRTGGRALLLDANGRPMAGYAPGDLSLLASARERIGETGTVARFMADDGRALATIVRSDTTGWYALTLMPLQLLTEKVNRSIAAGIAIMCAILAVALIGIYQYVRGLSASIIAVSDAMGKVGGNDFSVRVRAVSRDEIGTIGRGFNAMVVDLDALFRRAIEEERNMRDAQIRAMFYQIKPHFLYNTLASIRMYAMKHGENGVADMLETLNRLLRNTINIQDQIIPLSQELTNLRDYIAIHRLRYSDRIAFEIAPDEDTRALPVPNMIVQPVVENAIEHGVSPRLGQGDRACTIAITARRDGDFLCIGIRDDGVGMTRPAVQAILAARDHHGQGHIGLRNIHERLRSLYGDGSGVFVESVKDEYTLVTLKIPIGGERT